MLGPRNICHGFGPTLEVQTNSASGELKQWTRIYNGMDIYNIYIYTDTVYIYRDSSSLFISVILYENEVSVHVSSTHNHDTGQRKIKVGQANGVVQQGVNLSPQVAMYSLPKAVFPALRDPPNTSEQLFASPRVGKIAGDTPGRCCIAWSH